MPPFQSVTVPAIHWRTGARTMRRNSPTIQASNGSVTRIAKEKQRESKERVDVQYLAEPQEQRVKHPNGQQDGQSTYVERHDARAASRGARELHGEPQPEEHGEERVELVVDQRRR